MYFTFTQHVHIEIDRPKPQRLSPYLLGYCACLLSRVTTWFNMYSRVYLYSICPAIQSRRSVDANAQLT